MRFCVQDEILLFTLTLSREMITWVPTVVQIEKVGQKFPSGEFRTHNSFESGHTKENVLVYSSSFTFILAPLQAAEFYLE